MVDMQDSSSRSNMLYLDSAMLSFLLKKAKGCQAPCTHYCRTPPTWWSLASVYCFAELCCGKDMSQGCHI